jgi:hypothetical protein
MLVQESSKEVNIEVGPLPKYQHFLNDTVFNTRLCLRHLLVPEVKRKIQQALANIHSLQCHVKDVYDQWQMRPGLKRDDEFSQDISFVKDGICLCQMHGRGGGRCEHRLGDEGLGASRHRAELSFDEAGHAAESTRQRLGRLRQRVRGDAGEACEAGAAQRHAASGGLGGR